MFPPALSVGMTSVVMKIVVLIVVAIAAEAAVGCVKLILSLRLKEKNNAPFTFENDGSILNLISTIRRLGSTSFIGLFTFLMISVLIFPAEMAFDFGVDVSYKCKPEKLESTGICAMEIDIFNSFSKELATALAVEELTLDKQLLTENSILQGTRKTMNGHEYFGRGVKRDPSLPVAIANCSVGAMHLFPADTTKLTFGKSQFTMGEGIDLKLISVNGGQQVFSGKGGVFYNYEYYSAFLAVGHENAANGSSSATLLEYPTSAHLSRITQTIGKNNSYTVRAEEPVLWYKVQCDKATMSGKQFLRGISSYRFAQLARSVKRKAFHLENVTVEGRVLRTPLPLEPGDVVKAVIASKIAEPVSCVGETFLFTECGLIDLRFGFLLICVTTILIFSHSVLLLRQKMKGATINTPISAGAWAKLALKLTSRETKIVNFHSPEYAAEYAQYGRRPFLGEFVRKSGVDRDYFELRQVLFTHGHAY